MADDDQSPSDPGDPANSNEDFRAAGGGPVVGGAGEEFVQTSVCCEDPEGRISTSDPYEIPDGDEEFARSTAELIVKGVSLIVDEEFARLVPADPTSDEDDVLAELFGLPLDGTSDENIGIRECRELAGFEQVLSVSAPPAAGGNTVGAVSGAGGANGVLPPSGLDGGAAGSGAAANKKIDPAAKKNAKRVRLWECPVCGKRAKGGGLAVHMRRKHPGEYIPRGKGRPRSERPKCAEDDTDGTGEICD